MRTNRGTATRVLALTIASALGLALSGCRDPEELPVGTFTVDGLTLIEVEPEFPDAFHPDFRITTMIETGGDLTVTSAGACTEPGILGPNELYQLTVADVGICTVTVAQAATSDYAASEKEHIVEIVRLEA